MPRPGDLRDRVRIERRTQTPTGFPGEWSEGYGEPVDRSAQVHAMNGREAERAGQTTADAPHEVTLRADAVVLAELTPSARLTWLRPDHPLGDVALDVLSVAESDRRAAPGYLTAVCSSRTLGTSPD